MRTPVLRATRSAVLALLTLTAVLLTAGPASAHTGLRESSPAEGATLTEAPAAVTLTFSASVRGPEVTVTGPDGAPVGGEAVADGAVVTVPVTLTTAGTQTVTWAVTSADGHRLDGVVTFGFTPPAPIATAAPTTAAPTTTAPATTAPASAAPSEAVVSAAPSEAAATTAADDSGPNALVSGVVLLVLLGAGVGVGLLVKRRRAQG